MQNGLHGVLGLLAGPPLARRLPLTPAARRAFLVAFTLGNLLPDADWTFVAATYLAAPDLAVQLHRGFTHSLAAVLVAAGGFGLAARMAGDRELRATGWGLGLGVATHIFLDLLGWFGGVDLLWPLGYFGVRSGLNLWAWFTLPPLLGRILAALEYLAFAIYYWYLDDTSRQTGRGARHLPELRRLRAWMGALTAGFLLVAVFTPDSVFNVVHYSTWAIIAYPAALYYTVRLAGAVGEAADADAAEERNH